LLVSGRLAAVEVGLSVSLVDLVKLNVHAAGKGNALKLEMQAAAKEHYGKDLGEDEARRSLDRSVCARLRPIHLPSEDAVFGIAAGTPNLRSARWTPLKARNKGLLT
jgi:hypothetical protein